MELQLITWVIPIAGLLAIAFAVYLAYDVLHRDTGTEAMREISGMIFEGAVAFIRRQYQTIGLLALGGAVVIGLVITLVEGKQVADTDIFGFDLGWRTGLAFLVGAACSMASGIIGMYVSVRSNVRTAAAARSSLVGAVQTALRGGAVSGFLVVALSLLGVYSIFALYGGFAHPNQAPFLIVGFGFGASFVALFAQLGGGRLEEVRAPAGAVA
ncbi:MAG: sodium/proton-translocating pyrophosphatase, partial [Candidatus Limnocylindria bacterium]